MTQKKKLGLALGGGGSRALCHIGVIEALEEAGIEIDMIAGNSMGGIVGAHYAAHKDIAATRDAITSAFKGGGFFKPRKGDGLEHNSGILGYIKRTFRALCISLVLTFRRGFLWSNPCKKAVDHIMPEDTQIEDLKIPFAVVALNMSDGKLEVFTEGSVKPPVVAGTNVAVVFPPYKWNNKEYADAAPVCSVPVQEVQDLGAEVVLAVDIRSKIPTDFKIKNGFDSIFRIEMIESKIINDIEAEKADIVISPETGNIFWGDFSTSEEVIASGRDATNKILKQLKGLLA